ncbi:MAG: NAD-dependent epimerase/dehydratase family protein [Longimicrobiales bacterium]|nr:NAD-dependent epimerase/dehydratase family protein [Longimicrobiales bacterium]
MRVFLTGGTGLLGSHIAALLAEEGHGVVALCRPRSDTTFLTSLGCTVVEGDVTDGVDRLERLARGCTHAVHGAALVYTGGDWPKIRWVNVDGTRNILEAAAAAGVVHAVQISSVAVYGTVAGAVDEQTPVDTPIPPGDLYARSKREGEKAARAVEESAGMSVCIVRPSAVYGERDRLMTQRIARMLRGPVSFLLGSGGNTIPAVYAGNVAEAVLLALKAGRGRATFDVGMDHPLTQRALLEGMAEGLGRHPVLVPLPAGLVRPAADLLQALGVPAPGAAHLPLGRVVRLALGENPFASRTIREELGWEPSHRHEDALRRSGRWLRENPQATGRM